MILQKCLKTSRCYLKNEEGHDKHFWADFSATHSKHHWLTHLNFVNHYSQGSWSMLVVLCLTWKNWKVAQTDVSYGYVCISRRVILWEHSANFCLGKALLTLSHLRWISHKHWALSQPQLLNWEPSQNFHSTIGANSVLGIAKVTYCLHEHVPRFKYPLVIRKLRKCHFIQQLLTGCVSWQQAHKKLWGEVIKHLNRKPLDIKGLLYASSNNKIIFATHPSRANWKKINMKYFFVVSLIGLRYSTTPLRVFLTSIFISIQIYLPTGSQIFIPTHSVSNVNKFQKPYNSDFA